ncbi:MAG: 3-deoxy-D-manno-octulosonic acid transferase, partial [Gemmobacter sp.]|uniref:3-deoxy-D-manno-octulosonic acid transferase n=1 Tax=Gemmobacter sp. TaxID=1898957 RepID=UPI001A4773B1
MAMVEARAPHLPEGREGWFPGLIRASLAPMQAVLALDEPALKALRKAGAPGLALTGRMEQPSAVLPGNEAERAALAHLMNTRPVWAAVQVPQAEEPAVIEAHRAALGLAHRLLLILLPENPHRGPALARQLEREEGWRVALRQEDQDPEPETQLLIADTTELGLWYRLAPIAFLGGSLAGTGCLADPMQAAALGASVIHGPRPGTFGSVLGRLGAARATRSVATGADLAEALGELLSPDRAAKLAQAAWTVASEGVEVTARAHLLLRQMMGED